MDAVGDTLPSAHAYPAVQFPLHAALVSPASAPYVPAGHNAVHAAVDKPGVLPYRPALQLLQVPAPPKLYLPCPHTAAVPMVDPATHAYPAVHGPLHDALVSPDVAPNVPAGHAVHAPTPASEY